MAKNEVKTGQLPQEIEVWYILPALRREFAKVLIKEHRLSQKRVAGLLHITEAAVSQYISGKRASKVKFDSKVLKEIQKSAKRVVKGDVPLFTELERISKHLTVKQAVCEMCKSSNVGLGKCDVCFKD